MITGLYVAGNSPIHRLPAGWKLLGLLLISTAIFFIDSIIAMICFVGLVIVAYRVAGFSRQMLWLQLRPIWIFLAIFFLFQWLTVDVHTAVLVFFRMLGLIWLAALLTLTTSTQSLLLAIETALRPFERFGLPTHKISLSLALAIRFIPLLSKTQAQIRQAQAARGAKTRGLKSAFALIMPLVVHTLRQGDVIAEAIEARGFASKSHSQEHKNQSHQP